MVRGLLDIPNVPVAANADRERRAAREERRDAQPPVLPVSEALQALDPAVGEIGGAEHRDRDRRVEQIGLALLRDRRDFLERDLDPCE
jgi:hypothetical protein